MRKQTSYIHNEDFSLILGSSISVEELKEMKMTPNGFLYSKRYFFCHRSPGKLLESDPLMTPDKQKCQLMCFLVCEEWMVELFFSSHFRYSYGDCDAHFCIQAVSKPLSYALATSDVGVAYVHGYVGQEPSGGAFNQLTLNHNGMRDRGICPIQKH